MPFEIRPNPTFSWSHSRDRTLTACARRYYMNYYASHNGWLRDAPDEVRLAYVLKHLTTLHLILGGAIHEVARRMAIAIRGRQPRIAHEQSLQHVRDELNRSALSSHYIDAFASAPKSHMMLRDVWYYGVRDSSQDERIKAKMHACVSGLIGHEIWGELEACAPDDIILVDQMSSFQFDDLTVFAAPDLVYRPTPRRLIIGDFKTGDDKDAVLQLSLYALYLVRGLGLEFVPGAWMGRVINVQTGEDTWVDISAEMLDAAENRIRQSVAAMRSYLADPVLNAPLPKDAFPLAAPGKRGQCRTCVFHGACEAELRQTATERFAGGLAANPTYADEPNASGAGPTVPPCH